MNITTTFLQIDLQNLFFEARNKNVKIDFEKVLQHFKSRETEYLVDSIIYMVRGDDFDSQKFEVKLKNIGYKIFTKNAIKTYKNNKISYKQTKYDINITIDCLNKINDFNKWIFMSGDGGFTDLCKHVKEKGKEIELWSFQESYSSTMEPYIDRLNYINEDFFYKKPKVSVFGFHKNWGPTK